MASATGKVVAAGGKVKARTGRNVAKAGKSAKAGGAGFGTPKGTVGKAGGGRGKTSMAVAAPAQSARLTRIAAQAEARIMRKGRTKGAPSGGGGYTKAG